MNNNLYNIPSPGERRYLCLKKPLFTFLTTATFIGDPNGAMVCDRLRITFIAWLYNYLGTAYQTEKIGLTPDVVTLPRFTHLLKSVLDSEEFQALRSVPAGDDRLFYGAPLSELTMPTTARIGRKRVPCVFGISPRDKSLDLPEYIQHEIDKSQPADWNTALGRLERYEDGILLKPFTLNHWESAPRFLLKEKKQAEKFMEDENASEEFRLRRAKKRKDEWLIAMQTFNPNIFNAYIEDHKPRI